MTETISSGITLIIPVRGEVDWDQTVKTYLTAISSHDHTGSGKGLQLGTTSLAANAVDDTKARLRNNQFSRGRNAAGSDDVDIVKINASDQIEFASNPIGFVTEAEIQDGSLMWGGTSGGTANAQTITLTPTLTAYVTGMKIRFIAGNTNTGSTTLNIDAVGVKTVKDVNGNTLIGAEIRSGSVVELVYDGTDFELINPGFQNYPLSGGTSGGSANVQTITVNEDLQGYFTGLHIRFRAGFSNTGISGLTINVNSLGAKNVFFQNGISIDPIESVIINFYYEIIYDGISFRIQNPTAVIAQSSDPAVSTAGSDQSGATQITKAINNINSVGASTEGVKLPPSQPGMMITMHNNTASSCRVYPASGDTLATLSINQAMVFPAGKGAIFFGSSTTLWLVIVGDGIASP